MGLVKLYCQGIMKITNPEERISVTRICLNLIDMYGTGVFKRLERKRCIKYKVDDDSSNPSKY